MRKLVVLGVLVGWAGLARGHVYLMSPTPRNDVSLKDGPCGPAAGQPGAVRTADKVTTLRSGQVLKVVFRDQFAHTGHYRISFDSDGQDGFVDPVAENDFDNSPTVLRDAIIDQAGNQTYEVEVQLPDIECTNCTLQIIQVMTEAAGFNPATDIYYQCADLVLKRDAPVPPVVTFDAGVVDPSPEGEPDASVGEPSGAPVVGEEDYEVGKVTACQIGLGGGSGGWLVFVVGAVGLWLAARRR